MDEVDTDSITFGDKFVSIDEIGEGNGRILFHEFRFDLVEPLFPVSLVVVDHFVRNREIFHDHSDSFG